MYIVHTHVAEYLGKYLLWREAVYLLRKQKPKVVAIVGSVGKTSAKNAIIEVLSLKYSVRGTQENFNALTGACRTVLGLTLPMSSLREWVVNILAGFVRCVSTYPYPQIIVVETGISKPRGMEQFLWLTPDTIVYTRMPDVPAHLEYFESPAQIITEKKKLVHALKTDGLLVLNRDDGAQQDMMNGVRTITYAVRNPATVSVAGDVSVLYEGGRPAGMRCVVQYRTEQCEAVIRGTLGAHHMYPILSAIACGVEFGVDFASALQAACVHYGTPGRMRILQGLRNMTIIDDTYNASPEAVMEGLRAVTQLHTSGQTCVILGDMLDLGQASVDQHARVLREASSCASHVLVYGEKMREAHTTISSHNVRAYDNHGELVDAVLHQLKDVVLVYVKGSAGMCMERVVRGLLQDQAQAKELLVRQ